MLLSRWRVTASMTSIQGESRRDVKNPSRSITVIDIRTKENIDELIAYIRESFEYTTLVITPGIVVWPQHPGDPYELPPIGADRDTLDNVKLFLERTLLGY